MKNIIIHGDFREHYDKISKDCVIISDPPYNQKYHYSKYADNLDAKEYTKLLRDAFAGGGRRSVVIHYPEESINILPKAMQGEWCEESVAWVYNSNTAKQHRQITWWNCKPDFRKVGQPYKNPTDKRIAKRIADGKMAKMYDWWNINQVKNVSKKDNPHPCPIPYELAERIILLTTKEGDTVVDPFAGSGTVLLAAKNNKRNYIGFEIDESYFEYMKSIGL